MRIGNVGPGHHPAPPPASLEGALLRTAKDTQELEGEAALKLVESAKGPPPPGTGQLVNDVA